MSVLVCKIVDCKGPTYIYHIFKDISYTQKKTNFREFRLEIIEIVT